MFCTNCGNQLPEEAKFCPNCGSKIEPPEEEKTVHCTHCGNAISERATICPNCNMPTVNPINNYIEPTNTYNKPTTTPNRFNFFGLIGFVISIIAALYCLWYSPFGLIGGLMAGIGGLVASIVGLAFKNKFPKLIVFAIAGLLISIIAIVYNYFCYLQ
ncbi:MAG: zinc-ribbon domain-containing protein [Clostridia bacterium]|nr:zinc-ribbon domain-containing protein [Clostridia bacterium]